MSKTESKSPILFTKPHMLLVVSRCLSGWMFFVSISFSFTFHTVVFAPLIKTAEPSTVPTAAFTGFGGRVRLVLCNIIFVFILFFFFFSLGDYVQDASWLTDGDVFTHPPLFYLKKKTSQGRKEKGQEQLWTKGQTEDAHWPHWVMRGEASTELKTTTTKKTRIII